MACHSHGERLLVPRHRPWRRSACPGRRRGRRSVALARVTLLIGYTKADQRLRYADVGRPRQRRARLHPQVFATEEDADTRVGDAGGLCM